MKIGIMIDELASGSAPKVIGQEVKGLVSLGYDSEAITLKNPSFSDTYRFHLGGVKIRYLLDRYPSIAKRINFKVPGFSFFSFNHVASPLLAPFVVKEKEYDALISHISYTCLTARALLNSRKIPYFAFIGTEPAYYLMPRIYSQTYLRHLMPALIPLSIAFDKYVVEKSRAILTFSRYYHNLIKLYTDRPLEVVHPGCFPVEAVNEDRGDFILTFDRWDVGNTPNFFLDILPKLSRKIKLVIAGHWYPESLKADFIKLVSQRLLTDRVFVIGSLNESEIQSWCSSATVHVHPNKEAFGMQSLEAASCGCPTIIPNGSGVTEILANGRHGYFPDDRNIDSFVEAIDKIIVNPKLARKIGRDAWTVANNHTWRDHANTLSAVIKKYAS